MIMSSYYHTILTYSDGGAWGRSSGHLRRGTSYSQRSVGVMRLIWGYENSLLLPCRLLKDILCHVKYFVSGNRTFIIDLYTHGSFPIYRVSKEERSIFWEVIVSVILSKNVILTCVVFRSVSEIELFECTLMYIDVDGGIFEHLLQTVPTVSLEQ